VPLYFRKPEIGLYIHTVSIKRWDLKDAFTGFGPEVEAMNTKAAFLFFVKRVNSATIF